MGLWDINWRQYRENLAKEREEWDIFEVKRLVSEERMREAIESKREDIERVKQELDKELKNFIEKKKQEYKRRIQWAHRAYLREVEKKFKTSIRV